MIDFIIQKAGGGTINLYSKNTSTLSTVTNAEQSQGLNSDDIVRITVESAVKITFDIGDKMNILGRWYKINRLPTVKKTGNRLFTYNIELEGVQYDLARVVYDLTIDTTSNALQDVQADMLTGDLQRFATVLIANANRVFPGKWVLGDFPAGTEDKTLVFGETDNCLLVLQRLCSEYNTEFEIIQAGDVNTLHFRKAGQIYPYTFEYGKGKGLYSLERLNVSTSNIVTRLKVYGGTRNITAKYRAARLCLPGKTKGQSYIQKTGPANNYGIWEATKIFEHIYPKRTGTVTAIDSGNVLKLTDSTMNFDLNEKEADGITTKYLIDGSPAKIHFNTGNLSGYEFEIQSYDHATKTFTLKPFEDERGERFPSEKSSAFKFAVNDKYVLLDIALPQSYIDDAEEQLAEEGGIYYDQNSQPKVQYSLEVAEEFLKELSGAGSISNIFSVGDYIPVKDTDIDVDKSVRVQSFTRDLLNPFSYKLNISDTVTTNITNRVISELIEIDKITKINDIKSQVKARRDWRSAQELLDMVFDTEGDYYSEKIKPNSIETSMLAVGAKSTQFGLVGTVIQANYNGNKNSVNVKGGTLSHYAIEESGRNWTLADGTTTLTGDSTPYYIYAKCQKVGTAGSIIFSTSKITVDEDPSFYHFLIGVVNSVDPTLNVRSVALTYGFTTVNGKFIRTGRIQSNDGNTYFDLDTGVIGGKITFRSTAGSNEDLAEILDSTSQDIQDTQAAANAAALKAQQAIDEAEANVTLINTEVGKLQAQIDGEVSNWFYPYSPTLANYPASEWTTNAIKDRHIGDTFTNTAQAPATDAGKSWRFVKNASVYSWTLIADSDAVLALQKAAQAQSTADGKSTTFLITPSNYKLGDMWVLNADQTVNGTAYKQGEILTATQDSTTFNEAHWLKRVRYTDDTAIDNLEIGGRNLLPDTHFYGGVTTGWNAIYGTHIVEDHIYKKTFTNLDGGARVQFSFNLNEIGTFTFSIYSRINSDRNDIEWRAFEGLTVVQKTEPILKNDWKIYSVTFSTTTTGSKAIRAYLSNTEIGSTVEIDWYKLEKGNKATDWTPAPEDVQEEINQAKQEALTAANNVQTNVNSLNTYVTGAFKDGVIDEAEAKAIEKYKNTINETMAKAEASFAKVFANNYLEGTAKTALENAKINLWGQRDTLLSTINSAIADGKTTVAEKNAVDSAFSTFNNLMSAFQSALEEANKAIQVKLDNIAKGYVNDLEIGGRNLFSNSTTVISQTGLLTYSKRDDINGFYSAGGNNNHANYVRLNNVIKGNGYYTVSFEMRGTQSAVVGLYVSIAGVRSGSAFLTNNLNTYNGRKYYTVEVTNYSEENSHVDFHLQYAYFYIKDIQVEKGNKATDWSPAPEDVQAEIDSAKQEALTAAGNAQTTANSLKDFTDTAFRDGIIDRSESVAIEKYKNSLNEAMSKAEASYNKVYLNIYLPEGTAKTSLLNAKINLWGQRDTLLSAINTAISGGTTTPAQKTAVDNAFGTFNNLMTAFQNALEEANKAIQTKLDDLSTEKVNNIQIGGRNLFSVNDFVADNKARGYSTINVINYNGNIAYRSTNITNNHYVPRYLQGKFEANTRYYFKFNILWESYTNSGAQYVFQIRYTDGTISNFYATTSQTYRAFLTTANKTIDYITTTRQYDGTVVIYNIQLEKGNKPTDWTPAIEDVDKKISDVDAKAAEAQAKANKSAAITDKFKTEINGGLITTVMMLLREVNSQINTAGFSGIQGALLDQPSYWSGGTHIQAQAFVPFVKKLENEQSTTLAEYNNLPSIVFLHNGAAKIGHFIVLTSGEILIIDKNTGAIKLKFSTSDLPAIADLIAGTNSSGSTPIGGGVASTSSSQVVSGSTVVSKNGAIATFNGTHISLSARGIAQAGGMASFAEAVLYARQNGVRVQRLASVTVHFTNTVYEDKSAEVLPVPFSFPLDAGTYTFELVIHTTGTISSGNAVTSASNLSWKHTVAGVKQQQYAKDGMMFFYSNRHFYFNELTGLDVKESDSSKFNMPGVLLSATVQANGGWVDVWGPKQSATQPPAPSPTGRYTIYHSVGHTKYQVNCTPHVGDRSFRVYQKNTNSVVVECRTIGSTPVLVNAMFDIILTGNNYS